MRTKALHYGAALLITVALVGTAATAAERKDGRPPGSKPSQTDKSVRGREATGGSRAGTRLGPAQIINENLVVNGKVGINTASPVLDLHITTTNTPGMRLAQTAAGGFTAQTWDMAGNEANFFVRDVTGGSKLPFRIRPGAPTSSVDIAASGNVGLGTSTPETALHLAGSEPRSIRIERTGDTGANAWDVGDSGDGSFMIDSVGSARVEVTVTGGSMFRVAPVKRPPKGARKGAMYNDTSGALCWYSGKKWLKVVGPGSCS